MATLFKSFLKLHTYRSVQYSTVQNGNKMQAWQIHSYGDLTELQLTKARIPCIEDPKDVLVAVKAASVNPIDLLMIEGYGRTTFNIFRNNSLEFPLTLGRDFAGVVLDKGQDVEKFNVGDKVYGVIPIQRQGSHAEQLLINESHVLLQPSHLKPVEAASTLYTAMTAWSALFITGGLLMKSPSNLKVLILGASGGVGTMAIQILRSKSIYTIGTCSTDAVPLVRALGANNAYDYTTKTFESQIEQEGMFDIILDCANLGHTNIPKLWKYKNYISLNSPLIKNTDKFGVLGGLSTSICQLLESNISKLPNSQSIRWGYFIPSESGLQFIDELIKSKKILPAIHKVFGFNDLPTAYKTLSDGHTRGKIVIEMNNCNT
ncbi:hypothetical protein RN001_007482 [Aquatica leii]|uniref:Enoyl reductase (ER) domain-containing protein n=1 Tax=Aquatica leii TaxID=1421715 RepID=A0AAN7PD63_9COLE|nr:hypothetical protein RN001_007482 [Aquatica leii]